MRKVLSRLPTLLVIAGALAGSSAFAAAPKAAADESYADTRAHIENLIAQYLWAFDTQDDVAFASLFAPDGEVVMTGAEIPTPMVFRGPKKLHEFIDMMRQRTKMPPHADLQFSPNIHFPANLVLTVNGNEASGRLFWFTVRRGENVDQITLPNPNPSFFASLGRYEQEYVKLNGKWLFKRVTIAEMSKATVAPPVKAASLPQAGTPTPQEQANMKLVADFHEAIEQDYQHGSKGVRGIAERYLAPDYIQHMEAAKAFGQGREGYIRMFEQTPAVPPAPGGRGAPPPMKVVALMADGDLVTRINSRPGTSPDQQPIYIFNLYRVKDGRLAEHWDGYSRPVQSGPGTGSASGSGK